MNTGAVSNSTKNTDRNITKVPSNVSPGNRVPESFSSEHVIDSSTSPPVPHSIQNQTSNTTPLNTVIPPSIHHPYINMAAVAAAFLQGGFNPHMNNSPQSACAAMHPLSQGHHFFPPPPPAQGFIPDFSTLVSTSTPKSFATPLSVPLQSNRIPRSSPVLADKSTFEDSGIGEMMSPPSTALTPEIPTINSNSIDINRPIKRKYSVSSSNQNMSSTTTTGTNNSTTPTSTMTRTHQYKKVCLT